MHAMPRSWSPRPTPSSMPPSAAAAMRSPAAKRSGHVSLPHQRVCLLRRHDVGPSMSHGIGCPVASTDPKVAMLVVLTALIVGVATGFLAGGDAHNERCQDDEHSDFGVRGGNGAADAVGHGRSDVMAP